MPFAASPQTADPGGLDPAAGFDSRGFRAVVGHFVTGVTVVTAGRPDGRRAGVTVNSFTSLSLDPPLVLFCLRREGRSLPVIRDAGRFAVHVLAADQRPVSKRFAKDPFDWADLPHTLDPDDGQTPMLPGVCALMLCTVEAIYPGGDHEIVIGQVRRIDDAPATAPLVYHQGRYSALAEGPDLG